MQPNSQERLDEHVRSIIAWHFDPQTGSPFWLNRVAKLGFDPLREIKTFDDLARFPDVCDEWREVPLRELIPRGSKGPFYTWESGGTQGSPRRIVETGERYQFHKNVVELLAAHGFPQVGKDPNCDWLHVGPSGPHGVRRGQQIAAQLRNSLFYMVDLDPRWVKRLYRERREDEASRYLEHVIDQAADVLASQSVGVMSTSPPLLTTMLDHPKMAKLVREKVRGVLWLGTSMSDETLRLVQEELPDTKFVGWYGNTMMNGVFIQKVPAPGDKYPCIFGHQNPVWPYFVLQLRDRKDPSRLCEYDQLGSAYINVLGRDMFLPNHHERDLAIRVKIEGQLDGLARVQPADGARPDVEGVY